METGQIVDPYLSCSYLIEIDGIVEASFRECSGLESSIDVVEYTEGGMNTPRKLQGKVKYANIVLKKGITEDQSLYDWHQLGIKGAIERRNGSIILTEHGTEVARWNFERAWPARWGGPALNAEASEVAVEEFELAHEGIYRA